MPTPMTSVTMCPASESRASELDSQPGDDLDDHEHGEQDERREQRTLVPFTGADRERGCASRSVLVVASPPVQSARGVFACHVPASIAPPSVDSPGDGDHADVVPTGDRRRAHAGAPRRADRLLLPDAGLGVRRRGRRAGDPHPGLAGLRPLRGAFRGAHLALSHRQQRVLRRPARPAAPGPADGDDRVRRGPPTGSIGVAAARERVRRTGPRQHRVDASQRPGRGRRRTGVDPSRLRRRPPAPAAAAARRADPARRLEVAGQRGRRVARHDGRRRQQRAPAGPRHDGRQAARRAADGRAERRGAARTARQVRRRLRALRHRGADDAHRRGRDAIDAAVGDVAGAGATRSSTGGRAPAPGVAGHG